jgi:AcrR family transcriptional regulator
MRIVSRSPTATSLLDTAVSLVEAEGPAALTVRRVSEEAGMSTIGIYSHFASKEGLVGAVWGVGFTRLTLALSEVEGSGIDRVVGLATRYLGWAGRHPHLYGIMFGRTVTAMTVDEEARASSRAAFDVLVDACTGLVDDPEATALTVWQYLHGVASLEIAAIAPPGLASSNDPMLAVRRLIS